MRNTLESPRSVVPGRLSEAERNRISKAAEARDLAFSSFVRRAALERAADELERAKPKPRPKPVEREPIILEPEPPVLEEQPFRSHHFIDGECVGCGLEFNPKTPVRAATVIAAQAGVSAATAGERLLRAKATALWLSP